ncbi:MAG: M48 family metallopeptidase [Candidatus Thorarchaeota archaeon]
MESINVDGLAFNVHRSDKRKTVGITIERDNSLALSVPFQTSNHEIERVVRRKKTWILTKLVEKEPLIKTNPTKEYVSGEGFSYVGRSYRLKIVENNSDAPKLRFYGSRFELRKDMTSFGRELFIEWYKERLLPTLEKHLALIAPRIPVSYGSVQIRDLGYNWGTCGRNNDLYFHWRVAMLPYRLIEYIVTHELVHLIEKKHNQEFWENVETILPDYGNRVRWLVKNGVLYNL